MKFYQLIFLFILLGCQPKKERPLPNIVWIMIEDWGYQLSCYGEPGIYTPNVDKLATEGIRFTNSFCTSPVCSPSRSAMMTGFHQNYIEANQHRTGKKFGFPKPSLPDGVIPITEHLRAAGYYNVIAGKKKKTDLNFTHNELFDGDDWNARAEGQPFFLQITYEGTHRKWKRDARRPIDIADVEVPPYYPQTNLVKRDWANGLEAMQIVDREIGQLMSELEKGGLKENTLVFLVGDNGRCMPRGKQFLYDGGLQVPLIVRWPGQVAHGMVNDDLVSTLDIAKTILDVIGGETKVPLHGRNLLDGSTSDREALFAARDKMDSTHDASRAIRSKNFKLIHNLMPERPYLQFNRYKETMYPTLAEMNVHYLKGELNEDQSHFMTESKPEFELYDLTNDPFELRNLADDPAYDSLKAAYLARLNQWRISINDGEISETFREGGWPATYPTKTLDEWEAHLEGFRPWVFRSPQEAAKHPYSKW